jgi:hypothetical protein
MALWIPFRCFRQEHYQNDIPNLARNTEPSTDMHIPLLMLDVVFYSYLNLRSINAWML